MSLGYEILICHWNISYNVTGSHKDVKVNDEYNTRIVGGEEATAEEPHVVCYSMLLCFM